MADEFEIRITLDPTAVTSGMQQIVNSVQSGSAAMSSSAGSAFERLDTALSEYTTSSTAAAKASQLVAQSHTALEDVATGLAAQDNILTDASKNLSTAAERLTTIQNAGLETSLLGAAAGREQAAAESAQTQASLTRFALQEQFLESSAKLTGQRVQQIAATLELAAAEERLAVAQQEANVAAQNEADAQLLATAEKLKNYEATNALAAEQAKLSESVSPVVTTNVTTAGTATARNEIQSLVGTSEEAVAGISNSLNQLEDEIAGVAGSIAASFVPTEAAMKQVSASLSEMLGQFGAAGDEIGGVGPKFGIVKNISQEIGEAVVKMGDSFVAAGSQIDSLLGPLGALGAEGAEATTRLGGIDLAFSKAGLGATNLLNSLGATDEALTHIGQISNTVGEEVELSGTQLAVAGTLADRMGQAFGSVGNKLVIPSEQITQLNSRLGTFLNSIGVVSSVVEGSSGSFTSFARSVVESIPPFGLLNQAVGTAIPSVAQLAIAEDRFAAASDVAAAAAQRLDNANLHSGVGSAQAITREAELKAAIENEAVAREHLATITSASKSAVVPSDTGSIQIGATAEKYATLVPVVVETKEAVVELGTAFQGLHQASIPLTEIGLAADFSAGTIEPLREKINELAVSVRNALSSLFGLNTQLKETGTGAATSSAESLAAKQDALTTATERLSAAQIALKWQVGNTAEGFAASSKLQDELAAAEAQYSAAEKAMLAERAAAWDKLLEAKQRNASVQETGGGTGAVEASPLGGRSTEVSATAKVAAMEQEKAAEQELAAIDANLAESHSQVSVASDTSAASTANETAATAEATAVKDVFTASIANDVKAHKELTEAVAAFNAVSTGGVASQETVSIALKEVEAQAAKAGATLNQLENHFTVVNAAARNAGEGLLMAGEEADVASAGFSRIDSQVARATARMGAQAVGAGQLAYSFSILTGAIPALASAMSVLFAPILVITFTEIIGSWIEKFDKLGEKIDKTKFAFQQLGFEAVTVNNTLELTNLKLEDAISRLEGLPTQNGIAIGALEGKNAVDKLIDSFDNLIEKQRTTATQNEITPFSVANFVGNVAQTSSGTLGGLVGGKGEEELIAPYRNVLAEKLALLRIANDSGTEEEKKAAAQQAEDARKAAYDAASIYASNIRARQEAAKTDLFGHKDIFGTPEDLSALLAKATSEQAGFGAIDVNKMQTQEAYLKHESELKEQEEHRKLIYKAKEDEIKSTEQSGLAVISANKSIAETKFRDAQTSAKLIEQQAEDGSMERVKAELAVAPMLKAAQEQRNAAEAANWNDTYETKRKRLEDQLALDRQYAKPEDKSSLVAKDKDAIADLELLNQQNIASIAATGHRALVDQDIKTGQERLAAVRADADKIATLFREDEKLTSQTGNLQLKGIQEATRAEERMYSLGRVSRNEESTYLESSIGKLREKQAVAEAALRAEIEREKAAQEPGGAFAEDPKAILASQDRVKNLTEQLSATTDRWNAAVDNVVVSYERLDVSTTNWLRKLHVETANEADNFTRQWQVALKTSTDGFASAMEKWVVNGKSVGSSMYDVFTKIVGDATRTIAHIVAQFAVLEATKGLRKLFHLDAPPSFEAKAPSGGGGIGGPVIAGQDQPPRTSTTSIQAKLHTEDYTALSLNSDANKANTLATDENTEALRSSAIGALNKVPTTVPQSNLNYTGPLPAGATPDLLAAVDASAAKYGVDPALMKGLIEHESSWKTGATGPPIPSLGGIQAYGLTQLIPPTAARYGGTASAETSPEQNIDIGTHYFSDVLNSRKGDVNAALGDYGGFKTKDPAAYISDIKSRSEKYEQVASPVSQPAQAPVTAAVELKGDPIDRARAQVAAQQKTSTDLEALYHQDTSNFVSAEEQKSSSLATIQAKETSLVTTSLRDSQSQETLLVSQQSSQREALDSRETSMHAVNERAQVDATREAQFQQTLIKTTGQVPTTTSNVPNTIPLPTVSAPATSATATPQTASKTSGALDLAATASPIAAIGGQQTAAITNLLISGLQRLHSTVQQSERLFNIHSAATHASTTTTATNTATTSVNSAASTANSASTTVNTGATAANTTSVSASTTAHGLHFGAVLHSTAAHIGHAFAVIGSTIAHLFHTVVIHLSTAAHSIHIVAVLANAAAFLVHTVAVIADEIAIIAHAAIQLITAIFGLAEGGLIKGAGTGTSDSIPARLSAGEFVVKEAAVSKPGMVQFLHAINEGKVHPGAHKAAFAEGGLVSEKIANFATGGLVSSDVVSNMSKYASGGLVTINGPSFATGGFVTNNAPGFGSGLVMPATFAQGGIVTAPVAMMAMGGKVEAGKSVSTNDSHDAHHFNFNYAPQFGKDFNINEHGQAIASYMVSTLRRSGYNI